MSCFMLAEYSTYWITYLNTLHYIGLFICYSILRKQKEKSILIQNKKINTITKHCPVTSHIKIWPDLQFWRMISNFYFASLNSPSRKFRKLCYIKCLDVRFLNEVRINVSKLTSWTFFSFLFITSGGISVFNAALWWTKTFFSVSYY